MPHATHKARRVRSSDVPHAPVKKPRSRFRQQALLTAAVGFTMLIIVSLYASSFTSQRSMMKAVEGYPRWSLLDEDLFARAKPVARDLAGVRSTLLNLANAGKTQSQAAAILKAKIESRSASGTPETPETPETP